MSNVLAIFTTPGDATVELRHDGGPIFQGEPGVIEGRPAHLLTIVGVPDGWGATLVITRAGFVTVEQKGVLWLSGPGRAELHVDDVTLRPFERRVLPRLVMRGPFFALKTGERFTAIECSDFNLLARYAAGEDIAPVLQQRADVGFNLLRVWTLMRLAQFGIGDLDPCPYDRIPAFCDLCARYGLYVEFTAYTGVRAPLHWGRLGAAVQRQTNVLLELVNENDQAGNHLDASLFVPSWDVPCSHGSNGSQAEPVRPPWDYETFHTNDAPEWWRKVGHNAMELSGESDHPRPSGKPILANENTRCPDRFSSTHQAFDAAAGAALLCAGSCFHSVSGKRSALFEGIEKDCAIAWVAGARSVPLEFQDGLYVHRQDLEGPSDLRVYQRELMDGRTFTVRIRK